jgi:hypothetical protein
MDTFAIPAALKTEFATVEALWALPAETRNVDALILTWVKYEKQTRRLFSFLVLQNPDFDDAARQAVTAAIVGNDRLYPHHFLWGIEVLAGRTVHDLMGALHAELSSHVHRIQNYRNKIFHGQLTGQSLNGVQLKADTERLIAWIEALAVAGTRTFGYDGLERNTKQVADLRKPQNVRYPFRTTAEFEAWLTRLARGQERL